MSAAHVLLTRLFPAAFGCTTWLKPLIGNSRGHIRPEVVVEDVVKSKLRVRRAFEAMMPMRKIDVATLEAARRG